MDRRRLADVRAGTAGAQESGGSGYMVGQRLVLTCRHVVADDQGQPWPRLEVWLGHPGDGPRRRVAAAVAWVHPDRDAALLRIEGEPFTGGSPVRWGWFTGTSPVPYAGLGYPEFADYQSGRGVEQLGGVLPPLGVGADGGLVLDQGSAPEAAGRAWPGISGAAVFCQGLLTAVVIRDDRAFGNRRLHTVPVSAVAGEPEFARLVSEDTGAAPVLEAVELAEFLQSPAVQVLARTPGSLLAAGVEAVEFTGRGEELAELAAWRDSGEVFSVMLVAGEGGQGKTRLARQAAAVARQAGWVAGFLAARAAATAAGDGRDQLQSTVELARRVREATRPVLVVADYAETRPEEITVLADALASSPPVHPVRILLLSRTAGAWWDNLADALGPHLTSRISLTPLTEAGQTRQLAYAGAVTGLARHLAALPESPAERAPGRPWSALAEQLAAQPPGLDDPRLGNALTLQITALTSLLAAAAGQAPGGVSGERELVGHERGYLRRAAAKRKLFNPGVLSDRTDDDERAAEAWAALERALAGIILLGPCDTSRAQAIGALASDARAGDVVNWLAGLYPPPDAGVSLGVVQPDRLAELLLGPILTRQTGLLAEIGTLAETADDGYAALFTLMRTAAYPGFSQVGDQAANLIASRPVPFAVAAPVLAATLPRTGPLRDGLVRLGQHDPQAFRQTAYTAIDQLPEISVRGALFSAALTTHMADILRLLAEANPDAYLPDLAMSLSNLGVRLAEAGQRQAALAPAREAAGTYRQLAAANPDAYLPGLAMSLNNLGIWLAEAGQRQAAVAPAREAVTIRRQLAAANPDAYLPDLTTSLNNLGERLAATGQRQAALALTEEAADTYSQLAAANPDAYLPGLATTLNNLAARLTEADRGAEVSEVWEAAIAGLLRESSQLALSVAYASYLLDQPDPGKGIELLAKVLNTEGLPGPVEADARQLLRGHWRQHPDVTKKAWQSASTAPVPDWIYLTDDHINTVIGWINIRTWAESRQYFSDHPDQLLAAATTPVVLDELALAAPEGVIGHYRGLLNAIREHGLGTAYRPLLTDETLRKWIAAPDWQASRAFLHNHPQLLDEDIPGLLENLADGPNPTITVHQALLTLTQTPAGIDAAYRMLEDDQLLQAMVSAAIATRDADRLQACAAIETFVHGRAFAGALHMILAWLLDEPAGQLPEDWASELPALATQADPAEKDTALAQFSAVLAGIPADETIAGQLRHILSLPPRP